MVSGAEVPRRGFNIYYRRHDRANTPTSSSSSLRFPERRHIALGVLGAILTRDIHRKNAVDDENY